TNTVKRYNWIKIVMSLKLMTIFIIGANKKNSSDLCQITDTISDETAVKHLINKYPVELEGVEPSSKR
ncbi:MAG: hypothetical protein K2K08_09170, partial [Paramuribaculum sp.]|nr:hypothetical protein [Paramuribaculum sp.]